MTEGLLLLVIVCLGGVCFLFHSAMKMMYEIIIKLITPKNQQNETNN